MDGKMIMNSPYSIVPPGPAEQIDSPESAPATAATISSNSSEDSFISQMPLPFYIPGGSPATRAAIESIQQPHAVNDYQQRAQVPLNAFQQIDKVPPQNHGPLAGDIGNPLGQAHPYSGYTHQGLVTQAYQPQLHEQTAQSQMPYRGTQHGSQILGQHTPLGPHYPAQRPLQNPDYSQPPQMHQSQLAPHQMGHGFPLATQGTFGMASLSLQNQRMNSHFTHPGGPQGRFQDRSNDPSSYPHIGAQLGQSGSTSTYDGHSLNESYHPQGQATGGYAQNRATAHDFDHEKPSYDPLISAQASSINSYARSLGPVSTAAHTTQVGKIRNDPSAAPSLSTSNGNVASSSGHENPLSFDNGKSVIFGQGDNDKTPMKASDLYSSSSEQGATTPHTLRAREKQPVNFGTFKIDPVRGPPPAFLPKSMSEGISKLAPLNNPLSTQMTGPTHLRNISAGSKLDPFTNTITPGQSSSGQSAQPQAPMSGIGGKSGVTAPSHLFQPLQAASSGPLVLATQPAPHGPSQHLASIAVNCNVPSVEVAFDRANMPFVTSARECKVPSNTGVVRISNIPYSVTRQEIVAFLGRNARMINEQYEPIHIIMERVTSKTMDAYAEFVNVHEAVNAVNRYYSNRTAGRGGRLGERHAELEVVGHERLMRDLFPKAKSVQWVGAMPMILPTYPSDRYNSGFQGFTSREELVMLVKHVETPHRSPFSRECPQRPYECLISTLVKFPWYMVNNITLEDRDQLYDTSVKLFRFLQQRLQEQEEHIAIDHRLFRRVQRAILNCDGFTESMKDAVAFYSGQDSALSGLVPNADHWCVWKTIGPKRGIEPDVLLYYQCLIREATEAESLAERYAHPSNQLCPNKFGEIRIQFPENCAKMSLGDIANIEWAVIEKLLRKRLAMGDFE
ncbi:MAG: hypothetical protein M1818_007628 [Claussenomyces sp. TS43310]|nr:MAG: hypothetical protein M1818_007628 [Claussenomyces sp. TS43310]